MSAFVAQAAPLHVGLFDRVLRVGGRAAVSVLLSPLGVVSDLLSTLPLRSFDLVDVGLFSKPLLALGCRVGLRCTTYFLLCSSGLVECRAPPSAVASPRPCRPSGQIRRLSSSPRTSEATPECEFAFTCPSGMLLLPLVVMVVVMAVLPRGSFVAVTISQIPQIGSSPAGWPETVTTPCTVEMIRPR